MTETTITSAKYTTEENQTIKAIINGTILFVPTNTANRHYVEIMRQVEAGTLTIQPADEPQETP